jgi:hypothetical protein
MAGVIMIDITPEGSIVPIYLEPMSKEQLDADAADRAEYKAQVQAETDAKAAAKALAQSKLAALGLTVEDLTALGL